MSLVAKHCRNCGREYNKPYDLCPKCIEEFDDYFTKKLAEAVKNDKGHMKNLSE